ncbi:hypothetical protein COCSUDRAFT_83445 [Coccomyxa subellipsoidea C-169]|uniref:N-acetyltransferase domain-containing protein n=1 Tax=Coccomyxa subellipsoidea (strain C-169) TaxID=574566 RepID=I0ZB06_COCSC|nr:hypothetical protein COCSUDRAFT_83445 [Coccomyxa subellipsoidea C-169]EIE27825.1 hypothetical protein COCSUDRAFT_83445 [Coccomyxa subellipsoidea C-169]|eukprot:XP_005652369.1 hypothetical protein COCSUDRAFT_83445 [Coccomyxa subellipsoidea C-169]
MVAVQQRLQSGEDAESSRSAPADEINTLPELTTVRLICKKDLIGLYSAAGFEMVGPSDVEHGKDPWYEMKLKLSMQ